MPVPASRLITPVTSTSRRAGGTLALDAAAALDEMATGADKGAAGGTKRRHAAITASTSRASIRRKGLNTCQAAE